MAKIYAYMRCSTEAQMERNGFQMQENEIRKYCEANNIAIKETFVDEGISGATIERDGLLDMLDVLKKGDKILVQNTSRLWRADDVKIFIYQQLRKAGADIIAIERPGFTIYDGDPMNVFIFSVLDAIDVLERMQIAQKLRRGRKAKAQKGKKPCGAAPFGYKWSKNHIVPDPKTSWLINTMFIEFRKTGNLSSVARFLNEKQILTKHKKQFNNKSVRNILTNDFYIGILTYDGKKIEGHHEPLINKAYFDEVNAKILENSKKFTPIKKRKENVEE